MEMQRNNKGQFKKGSTPWNKNKHGVMPIPWNKGKTFPKKIYTEEEILIQKEKKRLYDIEYRKNNKNKIKETKRRYYQTKAGKVSKANCKYKRKLQSKNSNITTKWLIKLRQNTTHCTYCKQELQEGKVHLDHIIPLSKGGTHTKDNVQFICAKCNMSKGCKIL